MTMPSLTAGQLRRELNLRGMAFAGRHGLLHEMGTGTSPSLLFGRSEGGVHGNFHPAADARILVNQDWLRRLDKPHTACRRAAPRSDWRWRELDAACSSDALLMSVFCHPSVWDGRRLATPVTALLGIDATVRPCFGERAGVPLSRRLRQRRRDIAATEAVDRTEIDLVLRSSEETLYVEAKLTETDFQTASPAKLSEYRDLEAVFDVSRLPQTAAGAAQTRSPTAPLASPPPDLHVPEPDLPDDAFLNLPRPRRTMVQGYQLIRNVLGAYDAGASFCLLLDGRRRDLIETWFRVLSAIHATGLLWRLKLLTWQELCQVLPDDLQEYLDARYGFGASL